MGAEARVYDTPMTVKVRFAPSPTGFLHIGGVRTALFNWLFARHLGGEFHLRIENTDTGREVAEATEQIKESLSWLGLDWDGPVTFQLDRSERCQVEARRLLEEGKAYEDEGAIRIRMPDVGVTGWDDAVRGPVEVPSEELEDLVILRSDGRPTYNFASPLDDWLDGITHVIRGDDHVSNTPKQIRVLEALGAEVPVYAHVGNVLGTDGKKLSKRHGAVGVDEFWREGYLPEGLVNYLALLGWSYDDHTTIMSREQLVERFTIERVIARPATFDYEKLEWMNGVYLRELDEAAYAAALTTFLGEQGLDWDAELVRRTVPIVHEKLVRLDRYPEYAGFFFHDVTPDPKLLDGRVLAAAEEALAGLEPFDIEAIDKALRSLAESLELKPGKAFQPIRAAITGTNVSPSLFESIELLGREKTLERLRAARKLAGD
jgi:glutamyl-tRNA synthetase